jgi:Tol biopolymer transport system component
MFKSLNRCPVRPMLCLAMIASLGAGAFASDDYRFTFATTLGSGSPALEPSISADGRVIAFRSSANLTGQNADGTVEIFVYYRDTGQFKQVSVTPSFVSPTCSVPMILPDASKVCFLSAWDYIWNAPDGTFQIWEVDLATGVYRQITNNPFGTPVKNPRMSGDGAYFTYVTYNNLNDKVYRINRVTGETIQISPTASQWPQYPDINYDGSVIVWGGRANYDGTNADGSFEIWKWTQGAAAPVAAVTSQPAGSLDTNFPKVDDAGRFVCFLSQYDFSGGGGAGRKVFLADTQGGSITRITSTGVGGAGSAEYPDPEIAPDGSAVFFESNINLDGQNTDGNRELWRYDVAAGSLKALTKTTAGASIISLSDEATRRYVEIARDNNTIVYRSDHPLDPARLTPPNSFDLFVGTAKLCQADLVPDGVLDLSDFFQFFNYFDQSDPGADIDGNPGVDLGDFFLFFNLFDSGC